MIITEKYKILYKDFPYHDLYQIYEINSIKINVIGTFIEQTVECRKVFLEFYIFDKIHLKWNLFDKYEIYSKPDNMNNKIKECIFEQLNIIEQVIK